MLPVVMPRLFIVASWCCELKELTWSRSSLREWHAGLIFTNSAQGIYPY